MVSLLGDGENLRSDGRNLLRTGGNPLNDAENLSRDFACQEHDDK
jgi:hypothetical protein